MSQLTEIEADVSRVTTEYEAAQASETQFREALAAMRERIKAAGVDVAPSVLAEWVTLSLAYEILMAKACVLASAAREEFFTQRARLTNLKTRIFRVQADLKHTEERLAHTTGAQGRTALVEQRDKLIVQLADLGGVIN